MNNPNEDESKLDLFSSEWDNSSDSNEDIFRKMNSIPEDVFREIGEAFTKQKEHKNREDGEMLDQTVDSEGSQHRAEINCEIPRELEDFREKWEENVKLDDSTKKKIIKAVNAILLGAYKEDDGSMVVEFELNWKRRKIVDVNVWVHTDDWRKRKLTYWLMGKVEVYLWSMRWDDLDWWENEELAEYIRWKERELLRMPNKEDIRDLLGELWKKAWLESESHQIAMLMYMTWMYWYYWLSGGEWNLRSVMMCGGSCEIGSYKRDTDSASVFLLK